MFYTIYKTTNLIDGKCYLGKHITDNVDDDYLGSGIYLNHAIKKYGKENFRKDVLFVFDNQYDMENKEKELVTEAIIADPNYYNLALGGQGGKIVLYPEHPLYDETRKKISESANARSEIISNFVKDLHKQKRVGMYGKKQSDHQRKTVSEKMRGAKKSITQKEKQHASLMKTLTNPEYIHPNTGKRKPTSMCSYCNREIDKGNFSRYHGEKCKSKNV
jgi:hypothetical protein